MTNSEHLVVELDHKESLQFILNLFEPMHHAAWLYATGGGIVRLDRPDAELSEAFKRYTLYMQEERYPAAPDADDKLIIALIASPERWLRHWVKLYKAVAFVQRGIMEGIIVDTVTCTVYPRADGTYYTRVPEFDLHGLRHAVIEVVNSYKDIEPLLGGHLAATVLEGSKSYFSSATLGTVSPDNYHSIFVKAVRRVHTDWVNHEIELTRWQRARIKKALQSQSPMKDIYDVSIDVRGLKIVVGEEAEE